MSQATYGTLVLSAVMLSCFGATAKAQKRVSPTGGPLKVFGKLPRILDQFLNEPLIDEDENDL
jgi:hypothetical protein